MARNTRKNWVDIQATLKDYIVPIIGWLLVLILIYSFFRGGDSTPEVNNNENRIPSEIAFWTTDTEAFILNSWNDRKEISTGTPIYKGETLIIREWSARITAPDSSKIHLNKIGELKFNEDGSYSLLSSDAWFSLENNTQVSMRYANVDAPASSVISLTQNEAGSTVYVLAGSAKVSNLWGVSTLLVKWQKVSVSRLNAASKDADLSSEKWSIDSYFKWSDWFIENDGNTILSQIDGTITAEDTWSGSLDEEVGIPGDASGGFLSFQKLRDEMSVDTPQINISWTIIDENVASITINNVQVNISDKSFSLDNVVTNRSINDIVVKIYNSDKSILQKKVYTVYSSNTVPVTEDEVQTITPTPESPTSTTQGGTTYDIDATKFSFTEPSTNNKFSTSSSEVTIRGKTSAQWIAEVKVNGFTLWSFNGTTWRYHAFERFDTLVEWTNQYRVDYIGDNGSLLYTDYYTIVKKSASGATPPPAQNTATENEDIPSEETLFSE